MPAAPHRCMVGMHRFLMAGVALDRVLRHNEGPPPRPHAAFSEEHALATHVNERRYVTWRLPDRQFSKVHLQRDPEMTVCGKTLPRALGSPQPPIPAVSMCPECAASES